MRVPPSRRPERGFTVPEMVAVVAILGVLAAAMLPNYVRGVYKARRSEALYALRAIHDAESFYFAREHRYTDSLAELGFGLEGGKLRADGAYEGPYYTYTLETWDLGGRPDANYRATATGDIDGSDDTLDIVIIENALTVID
jgi:prepilin-type N-terminal cleavage/methylation domain-containing protein